MCHDVYSHTESAVKTRLFGLNFAAKIFPWNDFEKLYIFHVPFASSETDLPAFHCAQFSAYFAYNVILTGVSLNTGLHYICLPFVCFVFKIEQIFAHLNSSKLLL